MSKIITNRPTFGSKAVTTSTDVTSTVSTTSNEPSKQEIGAIWKATTKTNRTIYNVKFNLTKSKLQELLDSANGENVSVNFVGFDNDYNKGDIKRPIIRMYEARKD